MVIFEFINSCLSTYGPYYIIHTGLKLGERGAPRIFYLMILLHYMITQFLKLLILATITRWVFSPSGIYGTILEELVNIGDFFGIYYILSQRHITSVESKARIILLGVWWGLYDSIATNCLPYLMSAKSNDFTLVHIYRTASANTFLFANMSKICLIYLWTKYHESGISMILMNTLLFYFLFLLPVCDKSLILMKYFKLPQWLYLILQLIFTIILSLVSKSLGDVYARKMQKLVEEGKAEEKQ